MPANAPPAPPRQARRRTQTASPPKSGTGCRPAPVSGTRCVGQLRTAVRRARLHGPGHRPSPRPGHIRPVASPAKQPAPLPRCARPARPASAPKRWACRCSVSPQMTRRRARPPRSASASKRCAGPCPPPLRTARRRARPVPLVRRRLANSRRGPARRHCLTAVRSVRYPLCHKRRVRTRRRCVSMSNPQPSSAPRPPSRAGYPSG